MRSVEPGNFFMTKREISSLKQIFSQLPAYRLLEMPSMSKNLTVLQFTLLFWIAPESWIVHVPEDFRAF